MALVKNPLMSVEAAGTVAGITFAKTAAGYIAKAKPIPARSIVGWRPQIRSYIGWLSREWGRLTDAQRQSWRDWAQSHPGTNKFGDPFIMSGSNAFSKLNFHAIRFWGGAAKNDLPPSIPPLSSVESLVVVQGTTDPGDIDLTWVQQGVGIAADLWEIQIAGPFQSQGRVEVKSRFAWKTQVNGGALEVTISDLDEGFWYWLRLRYVARDGQNTAFVYGQATPMVTP